jgi:membrane protein
MAYLWSLKALSWQELAKRTCRKSWDDEVFGQAARLAFYYFLSLFPVLLLLLILFDKLADTGSNLRDTLLGAFRQILPREASALIAKTVAELNAGAVIGVGAVAAALGSAWGALNGTWAMMTGLNKAYEVKEERPWWKVLSIAFGLTIALGIMGLIALWAMLHGSRAGNMMDQDFGVHAQSLFLWRIIL